MRHVLAKTVILLSCVAVWAVTDATAETLVTKNVSYNFTKYRDNEGRTMQQAQEEMAYPALYNRSFEIKYITKTKMKYTDSLYNSLNCKLKGTKIVCSGVDKHSGVPFSTKRTFTFKRLSKKKISAVFSNYMSSDDKEIFILDEYSGTTNYTVKK